LQRAAEDFQLFPGEAVPTVHVIHGRSPA
jgi:hypothetical protein